MSRRESQITSDADREPRVLRSPHGEPSPLAWSLTSNSPWLLLGVMLVVGAILLSCSSSATNVNAGAQKAPTKNAASTPGPRSAVAGQSSAQGAPNAAPKPRLAEPKRIVPAPAVVADGKGPRIAFVNEEIDFGNVLFGDVIQAPFEFKNVGNEPLTISKTQIEVIEGC